MVAAGPEHDEVLSISTSVTVDSHGGAFKEKSPSDVSSGHRTKMAVIAAIWGDLSYGNPNTGTGIVVEAKLWKPSVPDPPSGPRGGRGSKTSGHRA